MAKTYNFTNKEIAAMLGNMAAAYEVKDENKFKIAAYQKASITIANLSTEVKDLWDQNQLNTIPGIGSNISGHLNELFKTGKVDHFNLVFITLPAAMFEFIKIPGIGPKTSYKLCLKLNIKDKKNALVMLRQAAELGKISRIEGFGEKSETDILENIKLFSARPNRFLLYLSSNIAGNLIDYMKESNLIGKIDILGSLRRKCSTVGDIDISVASNKPLEVIKHFTSFPKTTKVIEAGETKARIMVGEYQIDLMIVPEDSYGSLLAHFTGSKNHNIHLRELALKKGLSVSEYGIRKLKIKNEKLKITDKNSKLVKFKNEEEFYHFLGMEWIPPEIRENKGELELALLHKLPKLIDYNSIKGDLHLHSSLDLEVSHDLGLDSIEDMTKKARSLGYEYIALSEHNPSSSKHSENDIYNILSRKKDIIDKLNYSLKNENSNSKHKLFIFNSLEIDIKPNGLLAVPNKVLDLLDFAIVSIHSSFRQSKEQMTNRILKALDNPKVKILGHPTGRLILKREEYEVDWTKIFSLCKINNKYLEINSHPVRLDLTEDLIRQAIQMGVKLVINTDSHSLKQMDFIEYGIAVARKGWAKPNDIINTLGYNEIRKLLVNG